MTSRSPMGIPGVDQILKGGLLRGRSYLLVGSAGVGKTIFGLQWLLRGKESGEKSLYVTLTEPADDIADNVESFGWNLDGIAVEDFTPGPDVKRPESEYHVFPPREVEEVPYWQKVYDAIERHQPQRLVLDSLTQLHYMASDDFHFRKHLLTLVAHLRKLKCTAILLFESSEMKADGVAASLAVDGLFRLRRQISQTRVIALRNFEVEKMRGTDYLDGVHSMEFTPDGLHVFPHLTEQATSKALGPGLIASGVRGLDEMLCGGLETGTTTLFSGPTGIGKSTLTSAFARHHILTDGGRAVHYSFEETEQSMQARCEGLGLNVQELLDNGSLKFRRVNPLELHPDQFLEIVRQDVTTGARTMVMLDGTRGYQICMDEYGTPVAHMHNLTNFLRACGVTTLLTNEASTINGTMRASELGISHLADNIIILRYAERGNRILKLMACLKKRIGPFQPEFRQLLLRGGPNGVSVGGRKKSLRGVISGGVMLMSAHHETE